MSRTFAVIGLGRFGQRLAQSLAQTDADVIAIDREAKPVEAIRDAVTLAVRLDSTDEEALRAQGVHQVDVAIVGIGDEFESEALTVAILKEFGIKRIIARAENEVQARILTRIGADETVSPERESALRWAHRLMLPSLKQYVDLGQGHSIIYLPAPASFHQKTLRELDMRNTFGVNLIAIERVVGPDGKPMNDADLPIQVAAKGETSPDVERLWHVPSGKTKILPTDVLILLGSDEAMKRLPRG